MSLSSNFPTSKPSLNLDFANVGALDPRITFSRTSSATYTNSLGLIATAAAGVARFDYDPTTLAPLGLLIEEQRTNLLTYSEQFDNAAWTKTRSSVSANTVVSPDGTQTADSLIEDTTASNTHVMIRSGTAVTSGTVYTASFYAKEAGRNFVAIQLTSTFTGSPYIVFNLSTGAVGTVSGSITGTITLVGNGWYRCTVTATASSTSNATINYFLCNADNSFTYTGNGFSGIYIWGAQLEAGAFATSYIPTVASTVTRSADIASINTLSPWYNQAEGSFFAEWRLGQDTSAIVIYQVDDGTNTNVNRLRYVGAGTSNDTAVIVGNVVEVVLAVSTQQTPNTTYKNAMAYKLNDFARSADGGVAITDNSGTLPTVTQLGIGRSTLNTEQPNGHIRRISYYPRRLTNAELQALTS